jgi:hypothetical protein
MPSLKIAAGSAALCLALACAGCALPPENATETAQNKQYRTGSNLPVKEGQATDAKNVDPNSIQLERPRSIGSPLQKGG